MADYQDVDLSSLPPPQDIAPQSGASQSPTEAPPQTAAPATPHGNWTDVPLEQVKPNYTDVPLDQVGQEESSAVGAGVRGVLRSALPTAAGVVGGLAGGAAGFATAGVPGAFVGGIGAAMAVGGAARKAQDAITDATGLDSPESRAQDAAQHPYVTTAAEIAPAIVGLSPGAAGKTLGERLAQRVIAGGVMGGVNIGQQAVEKGISNIDPTEALVSAGAGAALPTARPWARGAAASALESVGAGKAAGALRHDFLPKGEDHDAELAQVDVKRPVASASAGTSETHMGPLGKAPFEAVDGSKTADVTAAPPGEDGALASPAISKGDLNQDPTIRSALKPPEGTEGVGQAPPPEAPRPPQTPPEPSPEVLAGTAGVGEAPPSGPPMPPRGVLEGTEGAGQAPPPPTPGELARQTSQARSQPEIKAPPLAPEQGQAKLGPVWRGPEVDAAMGRPTPGAPLEGTAPALTRGEKLQLRAAGHSFEDIRRMTPEQAQEALGKVGAPTEPVENRLGNVENKPSGFAEELKAAEPASQDEFPTKPQSLSAGAATDADLGYGPKAPRAAVRATNVGLWQRANEGFDKLFSLPRWIFAPQTISARGEQADKILTKNMAMNQNELAEYNNALQHTNDYFRKMSKDDRISAVTEYENGTIDKAHPGNQWMQQARTVANKLDGALKTAGAEGDFARRAMPSFFELNEVNRAKLADDVNTFKDQNDRFPTLGEVMKMGYKLKDDLVNADGSPQPQKVIPQQNYAKSRLLELRTSLTDGQEGWAAQPGIREADPILHQGPGEGLVKLDPALTNNMPLYAAPEVKAVYERYFNPTLRDGSIRNSYEAYMKLKTASTQVSLLGGIYHLRFMALEAPINEFAAGFARILNNPGEAIKDILKAPAAPYTLYKMGKNNVYDAVMRPESVKDPIDRTVNSLLKEGGQLPPVRTRGFGVTPELETGAMQGLTGAWKPAFDEYMHDQVQAGLKVKNKFNEGNYAGAAKDTSLASLRAITEGMQLLMHPMFNTYIPILKAGANFANMKRYFLDNPGLTHDDYVEAARKFVRATDNAMGELNQSTLYAPAWLKAIGNGSMVSLGWNIGDVKQFFGGARAFARNPSAAFTGKDYDPRIMYIPAFIAATAMYNIATQLLHGQGLPKDLTDVAFPRSGGTTKAGNPERIIQPGYEKDVAEAAHIVGGPEHAGQEFAHMMYNKIAPFPKSALDMFLFNKNFANKDIVNMNDPLAKRLHDYWGYFMKQALEPIMMKNVTDDNNPRSKIGPTERLLGNRHAPEYWQDPKQYTDRVRKQNEKAAKDAATFHKKTGY